MNVEIQSVRFDADQKLIDFIESKLSKIERFNDSNIASEVILKIDKDLDNGNKVAVIKLIVPGHDLVAESRGHTFEEAVDESIHALKKQIERYKSKL